MSYGLRFDSICKPSMHFVGFLGTAYMSVLSAHGFACIDGWEKINYAIVLIAACARGYWAAAII
jgi:hypothetical protein